MRTAVTVVCRAFILYWVISVAQVVSTIFKNKNDNYTLNARYFNAPTAYGKRYILQALFEVCRLRSNPSWEDRTPPKQLWHLLQMDQHFQCEDNPKENRLTHRLRGWVQPGARQTWLASRRLSNKCQLRGSSTVPCQTAVRLPQLFVRTKNKCCISLEHLCP